MKKSPITLSEKSFATQVEDLFKIYGWTWAHFRPAFTSKGWRTAMSGTKGFPDYVAARVKDGRRRILFIELKSEDGKPTAEQAEWLELLGGFLFRPGDIDTIARLLK